jgi:hypothetical protein
LPQIQIEGISIVLIGNLNPAIFHPSWFAAHNLIRAEEADAANLNIVHPDVASFKTEWLEVNIVRDRLQISTAQESHYEALRDIAVGILGLLSHTPIRVMGINRDFHFDLVSEDLWNGLGHRLVPKQDWNPLLKSPGMQNLVVQGVRPDDFKGYLRVTVQPSARIKYGVFIEVNDHYILKMDEKEADGAEKARLILSERWNESMERGFEIAQAIAKLGEKG